MLMIVFLSCAPVCLSVSALWFPSTPLASIFFLEKYNSIRYLLFIWSTAATGLPHDCSYQTRKANVPLLSIVYPTHNEKMVHFIAPILD